MPGRRKSEDQARKEGTYNATIHKGRSTKLEPATPVAPDWLEDHAAAIFNRSVLALESAGILSLADADLVCQYAVVESAFERNPGDFTAAMHGQLRLLRAEVGLTPQGRLKIDGSPQEKEDPAEEFFH